MEVCTSKYRFHKATAQAIVTIAGRDHLGPHGTKASKVEYDRLIAEWLAAGRPTAAAYSPNDLSIAELLIAYRKFARIHYRKDDRAGCEYLCVKSVLRRVREFYGSSLATEFGPLALKALRQKMIDDNLARSTINSNVGRIKRMFKWAVAEEMLPVVTYQALTTVTGLQRGRTNAKETAPVLPVGEATVDGTLPHLPAIVDDMVRIQRLTGCRPDEVCSLRPIDIDTSGAVWAY